MEIDVPMRILNFVHVILKGRTSGVHLKERL